MRVRDEEDERASRRMPRAVAALWGVLALLTAAWAVHEAVDFGGAATDDFFHGWVNAVVLWGAALICLGGAFSERRGRTAWIIVAAGLASWALADTIWSIRFEQADEIPVTSISDAFWLAWYPLIVVALALLVRDRVPRFELHRWIDGIVVMLILATPWVALFLEPVSDRSAATAVSEGIEFVYVICDAIIVGAVVGVYALMGWRPGRMWVLLGLGLTVLAVGDAVYSVQILDHAYHLGGEFDVTWAAGTLLIAFAAWEPHPGRLEARPVTGWRAIALPVAAQLFAIGIQIYAFFDELARSERVLTVLVLIIAVVQIIIARPRADDGEAGATPRP
jgi:hypothetical protein